MIMKFYLLIALIILGHNLKAQTQLEIQLRNLPLDSYLNKPIDTLLANIPSGDDTTFIMGPAGNINRGASFQINYPPNNQFWIYVNITDARYITLNRDARNTASEIAWP